MGLNGRDIHSRIIFTSVYEQVNKIQSYLLCFVFCRYFLVRKLSTGKVRLTNCYQYLLFSVSFMVNVCRIEPYLCK